MQRRTKFKISPTLLNNWLWAYRLDNGFEKLVNFLKLKKEPPTKEILDGLQFESMVYAYAEGQEINADHKWRNGIVGIGNEVKGGQFQVDLYKDITVDGVNFLVHGILDVLHAGVIQDVKTTRDYRLNKYFKSAQHSAYFFLVPDFLQVKPSTICEKLSKPSRLKLCEAKAIRTRFFPSLTMEYLFEEAA